MLNFLAEKWGGKCRFFEWIDPPICPQARQVIPGLLRRVNILEEELNVQKLNAKRLRVLLILAMGIIG